MGNALAAICGASTVIAFAVAAWAWQRRERVPAARAFAVLCGAEGLWNLGHLFEVIAWTLPGKLFWDSMENLPYAALAPAALLTAVQYRRFTGRRGWIWAIGLLAGLLALALAAFPWHGRLRDSARMVGSAPILVYDLSVLDQLLAVVTFGSSLLAAAIILAGSEAPPGRARGGEALAAALAIPPIYLGIAFALDLRVLGDRDVTPVPFALAALAAAWGLGRHQLFDITPVARGLILERLPVGVVVIDETACVVDVNSQAASLLGSPAAALAGCPASEVLRGWPPLLDLLGLPEETVREVAGPGGPADRRWFVVFWTPLRDPDGVAAGGSLLIRDVTEDRSARKQAESHAVISERRFRALFEETPRLMGLLAGDGQVVAANRAALGLFHALPVAVVGKALWETSWGLNDPYQQARLRDAVSRAARGEHVRFETTHREGGEPRTFDVWMTPVADAAGEIGQIVLEGRDITALRREQERSERLALQLEQAQRLEAIGRMAGGVAHDFNNILTVVMGNVDLLEKELGAQAPQAPLLEELRNAARTGVGMTRQLLVFSRQEPVATRRLQLAEALEPTRQLLRRLVGDEVAIEEQWTPQLWLIWADPSQLQQVLLNLAINARDAMPHGGRLTIRASNVDLDTLASRAIAGGRSGAFVCLEVSDTGIGMSAEVQARLFEPFFTTKGEKGTGLGLAVVHGVVHQNGGFIQVHSDERGTTFRLFFPRDTTRLSVDDRPLESTTSSV